MNNIKSLVLTILFLGTVIISRCQSPAIGIQIGNKAPEIIEKSLNNQTLKLSSLKGKIVLIDFWASWCKPCRMENPNVVSAYDKFKDQEFKSGTKFTIFSVSLDRDGEAWKQAIKSDNLKWEWHVCNPGNPGEYVKAYQLQFIPTNFLIDGNGIILASNLRGDALDSFLTSLKK